MYCKAIGKTSTIGDVGPPLGNASNSGRWFAKGGRQTID
jgi:hypothetical protein